MAVIKMWIHENADWPNFSWDTAQLATKLAETRHQQGRLLGKIDTLGLKFKTEVTLAALTKDVVKSSAIEGETLQNDEVRSSVARRLGLNAAGLVPTSQATEGIVELMLDATQNYDVTLTNKRLLNWHALLFPTSKSGGRPLMAGEFRAPKDDPMQVISGPLGRERVHFEAPRASEVDSAMLEFLTWIEAEQGMDPVLKSGISHLWFLTIHPFEDGNGRLARAISDMVLARAEGSKQRAYSLSSQIASERAAYYLELEKQQRGTLDITGWLDWYVGCLKRAIASAEIAMEGVIDKSARWVKYNSSSLSQRQQIVVNRMLDTDFEGHLNTSKYAKLAKCSNDSALRDIQDLIAKSVLILNPGGGRSTSYRLAQLNQHGKTY
jgi:Fic family protein